MTENRLRAKLESNQVSIGTRVMTAWPGVIEVLGQSDAFDYVEFLAEYAPYDLHDLENLGRAADVAGLSSMIKIDAASREFVAGRAMASGIQNLLFADVRTVEDAQEAVAAVRAEPVGNNGVRKDRRNGYVGGYASAEEVVEWCDDAVVAIMVEKAEAVDDLDEILAVEGIDMVQFGAADYSLSVGRPGEYDAEEVVAAERETIETALRLDVAPRVELSHPDEAGPYLEMGVRDFSLGTDVNVLHDFWQEQGTALTERATEYAR